MKLCQRMELFLTHILNWCLVRKPGRSSPQYCSEQRGFSVFSPAGLVTGQGPLLLAGEKVCFECYGEGSKGVAFFLILISLNPTLKTFKE